MPAKTNSKPCQKSEMELFPQIITGFRGEIRILQNTSDAAFRRSKSRLLFVQKPRSWMFDKVLNMLLNWIPKLRMFHFKSI